MFSNSAHTSSRSSIFLNAPELQVIATWNSHRMDITTHGPKYLFWCIMYAIYSLLSICCPFYSSRTCFPSIFAPLSYRRAKSSGWCTLSASIRITLDSLAAHLILEPLVDHLINHRCSIRAEYIETARISLHAHLLTTCLPA